MGELDLIGTRQVSEIIGKSQRTTEWLVAEGRLTPAATVSDRNLWEREWVEGWAAQGCPPGAPVPQIDGLLGVDDVAELLGLTVAGVRWRLGRGQVPEPDHRVSGALCWERAGFRAWMKAEKVTA